MAVEAYASTNEYTENTLFRVIPIGGYRTRPAYTDGHSVDAGMQSVSSRSWSCSNRASASRANTPKPSRS